MRLSQIVTVAWKRALTANRTLKRTKGKQLVLYKKRFNRCTKKINIDNIHTQASTYTPLSNYFTQTTFTLTTK